MKKFILLVLIAVLGVSCQSEPKQKNLKLTVLHTNDHHGKYWKDSKGGMGMAARLTLVEQIRKEVKAEGGEVLLLSGGDINTGTPESDLFNAEPDFKGMNLLKYDAMAVGNHEFDNPLGVLLKQKDMANFPFLSANIYYKGTQKRVFAPYIIKEIHGVKIAIIGFTTEDTLKMAMDQNLKDVDFSNAVDEAKKLIPQIKTSEKPDFIIVVTHMGHYPSGNHGAKAPGDVTLAKQVPGINLIVGGHTQKALFTPDVVNNTRIVQAEEWGKYVGRLDLEITEKGVNYKNYKLIPVNYKSDVKIEESQKMLSLLSPYYQQAQERMSEVIGSSNCLLDGSRRLVRSRTLPLGTLLARAQKVKAKTDFAIVNGGGIRNSLPKGPIKLQDVYQIHPFGNTIVSVSLTAPQVKLFLEGTIARLDTSDNGAFPHFDGISFKIGRNNKVSNIKINGKDIDSSKNYKVALNNFISQGKEGYMDVRPLPSYFDTGFTDALALEDFIKTKKKIDCADFKPQMIVSK